VPQSASYLIYALAWFSFGFAHSLLAAPSIKAMLAPKLGAYYRLAYNIVASLHVFAVWWLGKWLFMGSSSLLMPDWFQSGQTVVGILGIFLLAMALKGYDLGLLAGTAQIRRHRMGLAEAPIEPLHTGGLHAYVRHPIYTGAYLILWGNAKDEFGLATAILASLYLLIGTAHEERYLIRIYGDDYQHYRTHVPAVIPWKGRAL